MVGSDDTSPRAKSAARRPGAGSRHGLAAALALAPRAGAGLEIDVSYCSKLFSRIRLRGRYRFGENVTGWTIGLGISL